ncbi:hypothetical protein MY4824_008992 [Beauveria thailandica]
MHELHLWPFQDAVHAKSGTIMCSYRRINNSTTGHAGALAGLDMAMPDPDSFWGDNLVESVKNGSYQFKQDMDFWKLGFGMLKDITKPHELLDARDPTAKPVLLDGAVQGHVQGHVLLLSQDARLLLPRAAAAVLSGSRSGSTGYKTILPDGAISGHLGDPEDTWRDHWHQNERYAAFGGCGSGATTPANAISPSEALGTRAHGDGTAPFNDSVCLAAAGRGPGLGRCTLSFATSCPARPNYNQPTLQDKYTDDLVKSVAADSCNEIVVVPT